MKYALVLLLLAGTMQAQTRAQLKAQLAETEAIRDAYADLVFHDTETINAMAAEIEQLKSTQKVFIDFINGELNKPAPAPVIVRQNVPVFVPEPYAVPEPQTIRVIHDDAPYQEPWTSPVTCSGYDIPTPGLTLTYSNCR